jgi:predicted 3-demethylubiquinone-9 3-methyltransferase (glyoxalase superfamily)
MTNNIYPCLWFDGNAKEAAEFYTSVFEDSKINIVSPLVVIFELNEKKIMGLNGGDMFKFTPSISMFVTCETIDKTNLIWNKLFEGGEAMMPIDKYPWSERYGWLQDKFGFTWQISVVNNPGDKMEIRPSMLFTDQKFGQAKEAVDFYTSVFNPSSIDFMVHYPDGDANAGKVMYSEFSLNNYKIIAMDGPGSHNFTFNEAVSFVVDCETQDEIDYYWEKLTAGGQESMCGWLKDRFGVSWQIVPTILAEIMSEPERAERVTKAFMNMRKLDLETLLKA